MMQQIEQNGYSRDEVTNQLTFQSGERELSFRYELLDDDNKLLRSLNNVLGGKVQNSYLADIKRTASFKILDDGSINYLNQRIRPWARIKMPGDSRQYSAITTGPKAGKGVLDDRLANTLANFPMDDSNDDLRRNLCTNPNFETNDTGWASLGDATIATSTTEKHSGTTSLKITATPDSTDDSGAQFAATIASGGFDADSDFTFSVWVFIPAGQTLSDASLNVEGTNATIGAITGTIVAGTWSRLSAIVTTKESGAIALYALMDSTRDLNDVMYIDDVLVEPGDALGDYFDGGTTGDEFEWDGTANASASRKLGYAVDLISGNDAIIGNNVSVGTTGIVKGGGASMTFPGATTIDDVLTMPADALTSRHGAVTAIAWLRPDTSVDPIAGDIFSQPDEATYYFKIGFDSNGDLEIHTGTESHSNKALGGIVDNPFSVANLRMVVVVFESGSKPVAYLNGVKQIFTIDVTDNQYNSSPVINLNSVATIIGSGYTGDIDNLALLDVGLQEDQIWELWRAGMSLGPFGSINYAEWPQGVFLLSTPTRSSDDNEVVTRDVTGYDQLQVYSDDLITDRFTVDEGDAYIDTILGSSLLDVPTTMGYSQVLITPSSSTLPAAKDYGPGTSKLAIINDLLAAINYESLSFNELGQAVLVPYVRPSKRTAEYTYADDQKSVILPAMQQTLDLFSIPNKWVLVVSNADQTALTSTYTNDSALSPTSTVNRGRTIVDYLTEQDAPDQTTLDNRAENLADKASQVYEEVTMTTAIMPFHSDNDVIALYYSTLAIHDKYSETQWSFSFDPGATMSHNIRRQVQL